MGGSYPAELAPPALIPTPRPSVPNMRPMIALLLLTTPAHAWDFTPSPICTIAENTPDLSIRVTYDPALSSPYAITLTRPTRWSGTETFGLRFDGLAAMTIGTSVAS